MAYTDLTDTFGFNEKILWTDLDALAENQKLAYDGLNVPMFSAYGGGGFSSGSDIYDKLTFTTEDYDTHNYYSTVNSRFTPLIAGYYLLTASFATALVSASPTRMLLALYKNGAKVLETRFSSHSVYPDTGPATWIVNANGSTDFFEVYLAVDIVENFNSGPENQRFQGFRIAADV